MANVIWVGEGIEFSERQKKIIRTGKADNIHGYLTLEQQKEGIEEFFADEENNKVAEDLILRGMGK